MAACISNNFLFTFSIIVKKRLKVFLTVKAKIFESETELWIDGKEIVQLFLSISFILNRWKGNNNRNFIPNMNRLKEQNV